MKFINRYRRLKMYIMTISKFFLSLNILNSLIIIKSNGNAYGAIQWFLVLAIQFQVFQVVKEFPHPTFLSIRMTHGNIWRSSTFNKPMHVSIAVFPSLRINWSSASCLEISSLNRINQFFDMREKWFNFIEAFD